MGKHCFINKIKISVLQCTVDLVKVFETVEEAIKLPKPPNIEYPLLQLSIYPFGGLLNIQSDTSELVKTALVNSEISEISRDFIKFLINKNNNKM